MFTQFFGNYLLSKNYITTEQLAKALLKQKETRVKLGVLAINAGYMTAKQVDEIHAMQMKTDKRFGDLACEIGYINGEQLLSLLAQQKTSHLLLGQTLIDLGYISNEEFEHALNSYLRKHAITDIDFTDTQNDKVEDIIQKFYQFNTYDNAKVYIDYVSLLFKNIIRFVGDDFIPLEAKTIKQHQGDWIILQEISGPIKATTAISADEKSFLAFASRCANETFTENNEYAQAAVADFLNLHNGLFAVNTSIAQQGELDIHPQDIKHNSSVTFDRETFLIPVAFSFGTIQVVLTCHN